MHMYIPNKFALLTIFAKETLRGGARAVLVSVEYEVEIHVIITEAMYSAR